MIRRLDKIAVGEMNPTQIDLDFYAHELREFVRYRQAGFTTGTAPQAFHNAAHYSTLREYGIPFENHPDYLHTSEALNALFKF